MRNALDFYVNFDKFYENIGEPSVLIVDKNCTVAHDRASLKLMLRWKVVDVAKPEISVVEFYKKAVEYNVVYDIIIMNDFPPNSNCPANVKELRDLGFSGYVVCIVLNFGPRNIKKYLDGGASKVLPVDLRPEYVLSLPEGPSNGPLRFKSLIGLTSN